MKTRFALVTVTCVTYAEILLLNFFSVFLDNCNQVHTLTNGSIKSPNYPSYYPSYAKCQYLINNTDHDKSILVEFLQFNLEYHSSCRYDSVKIYDGINTDAPIIGKVNGYCGSRLPSPMMSTGNALLIVFVSDGGTRLSGFVVAYKVVGMFL